MANALAATPVGVKFNNHVLLASSSISLPELASKTAGLLEAPPAGRSSPVEQLRKITEHLGKLLKHSKQMALQTQQMTKELALQTQQMTTKQEELAMQTQQMTTKQEELAMQTQQMTKKQEELAVQTQQMRTEQKKLARQTQQMRTEQTELASQTQQMRTEQKELASQTQQMTIKQEELEDEITQHKEHMFYPLCIQQLFVQAEERIKHGAGVLTVEQEALAYAKQCIKAGGGC